MGHIKNSERSERELSGTPKISHPSLWHIGAYLISYAVFMAFFLFLFRITDGSPYPAVLAVVIFIASLPTLIHLVAYIFKWPKGAETACALTQRYEDWTARAFIFALQGTRLSIALFLLALVVCAAFILGYQIFLFLDSGNWHQLSVIWLLQNMGSEWASSPASWLGMFKVLDFTNASVGLVVVAAVLAIFCSINDS